MRSGDFSSMMGIGLPLMSLHCIIVIYINRRAAKRKETYE